MRRRREMLRERRNCKPPLEKFEAEKLYSGETAEPVKIPELGARSEPLDRYSELLRLYRIEGAEAVRAAFTVEELRKLSRLHGFEIGSARTKAQIIEVLLG